MSDYELSGEFGDQLGLGGMIPTAGERYRNVHTGSIVTVVSVQQRRHAWLVIRGVGGERAISLGQLEADWRRMPG